MTNMGLENLPLFVLNAVLFPDELLPLRVFEARYLDMISASMKNAMPFGVSLIAAGPEVGAAAEPAPVGTLASIERWDMETEGVLHILVRGGERFEVVRHEAHGRLVVAAARRWAPEAQLPLPAEYGQLGELLQRVLREQPDELIPPPHKLDDAGWVGMRLAQLLPVANSVKQAWLELRDPVARLAAIVGKLREIAAEQPD